MVQRSYDESSSKSSKLNCGDSFGSLHPVTQHVTDITRYADDTQLYIALSPDEEDQSLPF